MPPVARHPRTSTTRQRGFGLLAIIITAALGAAVVAVAYTAYEQAQTARTAAKAAQQATELGQRVRGAYQARNTFDTLSTASALHDGLYPKHLLNAQGQPVNPWLGSIQLAGLGNGFAVTFENVSPRACVRFVTGVAGGWDDIKVNGGSVVRGHTVQTSRAATLCSAQPDSATVQLLSQRMGGTPTLTACVPAAPETRPVNCQNGQVSSVPPYSVQGITQTRSSVCVSAYAAPAWTPWSVVSDTCVPACTPPSPAADTQTLACPSNQIGAITQQRVATCPSPVGAPIWGAWTTTSNTCAAACVVPSPSTKTQILSCPGTQTGSITQQQTASCPNPTGSPVWSDWVTTSNTCADAPVTPPAVACVVPSPSTKTQTLSCPSPQTGSITQQQTASCPNPTGSPVWSGWVTTSNTCATPTYRWTLVSSQSYGGHGGEGQEYYTCSWNNPGESDIGNNFSPGPCTAAQAGQQYYCSTLVPQSHDDIQDDTYACQAQ